MSRKEGIDLIQWQPDYTKSKEENDEAYRRAYRDVYGKYPPAPTSQEELDRRLKAAKSK